MAAYDRQWVRLEYVAFNDGDVHKLYYVMSRIENPAVTAMAMDIYGGAAW